MSTSYRKRAIQAAREYANFRPIFLDTETTGLHNTAEIVEISVVDYNGSVLLDTLIKPVHSIPWEVIRVHGITDEMVVGAPLWTEVWPQVEKNLQGRYVGIYNADFDIRMMKQSHFLNGISWEMSEVRDFCIMKLYAQFNGSGRWQKLESAGRQCGLALPNTHRAKDDTLLVHAIFKYMVNAF
jgi:DNA polymerase III epsilon subunit-like protein